MAFILESIKTSANLVIEDGSDTSLVLVDGSTASEDITITLPLAANSLDRVICVKCIGTNSGNINVTIEAAGSDGIDGWTTWSTANDRDWIWVQCDEETWHIIGSGPGVGWAPNGVGMWTADVV
jgi:hypothetical protein